MAERRGSGSKYEMTGTGWRQRQATATLLAGAFAAGLCAVAPGARADEVSAEGAEQLEQQVHDWLASLLGPQVDIGEHPLQVAADGDHYTVELPYISPLGGLGITAEGNPFTASLKPLEGGRWAIDDMRIPSPLRLSYPIPAAANGGVPGTGLFTAKVGSQDQHGVFDPSFATPSHWDIMLKDYSSKVDRGADKGTSAVTIDEMTGHVTIDPAEDGRVNIVEDVDSHLIASNATTPQTGVASFSAERLHGGIRLKGVSPDGIASLVSSAKVLVPLAIAAAEVGKGPAAGAKQDVHALVEKDRKAAELERQAAEADKAAVADGRMTLAERKQNADDRRAAALARQKVLQAARAAGDTGPTVLTADQKAATHDALVALMDLMTGFEEHQTFEDVHVAAAKYSGHVGKLEFGFGAGAPDGRAAVKLDLVLDDLDSPDVPPGIFRDYMPRHIAIAPRIGGVPAEDLRKLLLRAADSEGKDPMLETEAKALLAKGPVVAALDEVSVDFGPATLKGSGELRISGEKEYEGEAHLTATGLDELIKQAGTVPELKQAGPVLFLLKGMGRQDGATTVWDITYRDNKVLVNGNDLSQMLPGK